MLIDYEHLTLCDLALSSTMYNSLTPYNDSLRSLKSVTGNSIDLNNSNHRTFLVKWLNDWGCRHLSKKSHDIASAAILDWHNQEGTKLFQKGKALWELDNQEMERMVATALG